MERERLKEEDQYSPKLEDVFFGQKPISKISWDVNSTMLLASNAYMKKEDGWKRQKNEKKKKEMKGYTLSKGESYTHSSMISFTVRGR